MFRRSPNLKNRNRKNLTRSKSGRLENLEERCLLAVVDFTALGTGISFDFQDFTGTGFSPTPSVGQLDSNQFIATGGSDDDPNFMSYGDTRGPANGNADYGRGIANTQTTGGVYAFDIADPDDFVWGVQPGGSDFTPGTLEMRVQNATGSTINDVDVSYDIAANNNEDRANSLNFTFTTGGGTRPADAAFTQVASLDYTSPEAADAAGWTLTARSTTLTGVSIAPGDYLYIRWTTDDVSGSGSRDEIGLNDISLTPQGMSNSPPVAQDDGLFTVDEDTVLNVPDGPTDLLANDTDPDGDTLTVISADATSAAGAAVTVNPDGSFTYDPTGVAAFQALDEGGVATDGFTYTIAETPTPSIPVSGLLGGSLSGNPSTAPNPGNFGSVAGPQGLVRDNTLRNQHWGAPRGDGTGNGPGSTTLVYTGQVFLQSGITHFIEANDDITVLTVDGNQLINDNQWNVEAIGSFDNTGPAGWFDIDLRFSNGGGGYGFTGQAGWTSLQFGFLMGHESVIEDPADETDPDYFYPEDDGSMNLFRNFVPDPNSTDSATVTFEVIGVNDAPVANNDSASITEALDGSPSPNEVTGNVLSNDTDVDDPNSSFSVTNPGTIAGTYGSLLLNTDGSYTYTLDDANPAVNGLLDSQSLTDTFNYTMNDNHSGGNEKSDNATLSITINGVNDTPVATDNTAQVDEGIATTDVSTDTGNLITDDDGSGADSDPDHPQSSLTVLQVNAETNSANDVAGTYGSLDWEPTGDYTYNLDNTNSDVQELAVGESLTDTFTYTVADPFVAGDGLFNVAMLQVNRPNTSADDDLDSTTETLGIWNAIDGGATVPGVVSTNGQDYDLAYETGTATRIIYNGNNDGYTGSMAYSTIGAGSITGGDDLSIRVQAFLTFNVGGDYSISTGSDDGRRIELTEAAPGSAPGFSGFTAQGGQTTGAFTPSVVFFDGTTGHNHSTGTFTVAAGDTLLLDTFFFERGGGDNFDLAIKNANDTTHGGVSDGWSLLTDGAFGIAVSSTNSFTNTTTDTAMLTVTIDGTNDVPTVANAGNVTVDEGSLATNSGSFADIDASDSVTITAEDEDGNPIGTITQDSGNTGNWSWEWPTTDGPGESETITIIATDLQGATSQTTFDLTVNNVAPELQNVTVTDADENQTVTLSGDIVGETSPVDTFILNVNWNDPNNPGTEQFTFPAGTTDFSVTHTYPDDATPGTSADMYDIRVSLTDDDANSIGVNFSNASGGGGSGTADVTSTTGVHPNGSWNNVVSNASGDGSQADLNANAGATPTDVAWTSNNTWSLGAWPNDGGIGSLYRTYLDTSNGGFANGTNISFTDLGFAGYDIYIYFDGDGTGRSGDYEVNDGTITETQVGNDNANGGGSFVLDNGTSADSGNYLRFVGLTGTSPTIRSGATSGFRAGVNAVQLVEASVVTVTTTITNVEPDAADDPYTTDENTALTIAAPGLLTNDTDDSPQDQAILAVTDLNSSGSLTGTSQYGAQVTLAADGGFTYDPSNAAALQALSTGESIVDSFTYTIADDDLGSGTATVTITVTGDATIEVDTSFDHVFLPASAPPGVTAPVVPSADGNADQVTLTVSGGTLDITVNGSLVRSTTAIGTGTPISVVAQAADTLMVDDSADTLADTASVDVDSIDGVIDGGSSVAHTGVGTITIQAGSADDSFTLNGLAGGALATLNVWGNDGNDTFVTTPQSVAVNVNGNSPVLPADPGDTLDLDLTAEPVPLVIPTTVDGAFQSSDGANDPVNWLSIETFVLNGEVVPVNRLFVELTPASDRVVFYQSNEGFRIRINSQTFPLDGGEYDTATIEAIEAVGRDGSDRIQVANGLVMPVEFDGGAGNDYLAGGVANDILRGGIGNDILLAGEGDNVIDGGAGNDRGEGRSGADRIYGGTGNDRLNGGAGDDIIDGGSDNDYLFGGLGDDLLLGRAGADNINGYYGNDVIFGGDDADQLFGGSDDDFIAGGLGADRIRGDHGNDDVIGGTTGDEGTLEDALDDMIADFSLTLLAANPTLAAAVADWQDNGVDYDNFGALVPDLSLDELVGGSGLDQFHSEDDFIRDLRPSDGDEILM